MMYIYILTDVNSTFNYSLSTLVYLYKLLVIKYLIRYIYLFTSILVEITE